MDRLYAPWREKYVRGHSEKNETTDIKECIFCTQYNEKNDDKNFILARYKHYFVMLNLYPYNGGHVLIVSNEHRAAIEDFLPEQRTELIELVAQASMILKKELKAEGINVGVNSGRAAGAGIPAHFHLHVLPRWIGDTNFMPLIADTKQIGINLSVVYKQLKPLFNIVNA
ncbi:MAG: AP-4-A phosphorylase [Candidatus Dependentiae bacterium ADurb.Bin331]|nr:MAG: AP-4-A phosphorylase [Candidatus Dependentiae bacterium ADurb.Bin331]